MNLIIASAKLLVAALFSGAVVFLWVETVVYQAREAVRDWTTCR